MIETEKPKLDAFFAQLLSNSEEKQVEAESVTKVTETKTGHFQNMLNRFIDRGVWFEVSADKFLIYDEKETLKRSDLEFLKIHYSEVLCTLQQSLLTKHLFSHSSELLENFSFEIQEREALLQTIDENPFMIYQSAVKAVTRSWFEYLVEIHILGGNSGNRGN
jgi:hypothetical protein